MGQPATSLPSHYARAIPGDEPTSFTLVASALTPAVRDHARRRPGSGAFAPASYDVAAARASQALCKTQLVTGIRSPVSFPSPKRIATTHQTSVTATSETRPMAPTLLTLPAELRVEIYEAVLLSNPSSLDIMRVCHQINTEALPTLYQRRLTFNSQADLFTWLNRSRSTNLQRVRSLTLKLTDVDLAPVLDPAQRYSSAGVWTLYQRELERLADALAALPKVTTLTVTPPTARHSQLLRGLYLSFLALIPRRLLKLARLEIEDSLAVLGTVPMLRQLKTVVCTVPERQPSEDTAAPRESPHEPEPRAGGFDEVHDKTQIAVTQIHERCPARISRAAKRPRSNAALTTLGSTRVCKAARRPRRGGRCRARQ
ncbi:hypothetical protein LTR53_007238 [Teratosphaeriaceae sp. CCFEE 6253]|nr:hypothetical protein LTR53_007238 [Teratosphaeriaceae sp. CCFEE 6253]